MLLSLSKGKVIEISAEAESSLRKVVNDHSRLAPSLAIPLHNRVQFVTHAVIIFSVLLPMSKRIG